MFGFRDTREGGVRVDVAFTDSSVDLQGSRPTFAAALAEVEAACGVRFARLNQVHGDDVLVVDEPGPAPHEAVPSADALVTRTPGVGLMVRVADCVPVLLADVDAGVIGAVHAGRAGMVHDVVGRTAERMRELGAVRLVAWLGPHVCGGCYEVPAALQHEVATAVPSSRATTTWGTPSLDLGAGVRTQLEAVGAEVTDASRCTREHDGLHSYRRDGETAGRFAGLVWTS